MSVYVPVKLSFEFEHITPLSAGGKNAFENLCLACPTC